MSLLKEHSHINTDFGLTGEVFCFSHQCRCSWLLLRVALGRAGAVPVPQSWRGSLPTPAGSLSALVQSEPPGNPFRTLQSTCRRNTRNVIFLARATPGPSDQNSIGHSGGDSGRAGIDGCASNEPRAPSSAGRVWGSEGL